MPSGPPSREAVRERLVALLVGDAAREEVADWAGEWVRMDEPTVDDPAVWSALCHLAGADLQTAPGKYLHQDIDFHAWLDELENRIDS